MQQYFEQKVKPTSKDPTPKSDGTQEESQFDDVNEDLVLREKLNKKYDATQAFTKPFGVFVETGKME